VGAGLTLGGVVAAFLAPRASAAPAPAYALED